jgi:hypothetical protein
VPFLLTENNALLPVYKVRLNAYALIAESIGLKPVSRIGLIHYKPHIDVIETDISEHSRLISYDNFLMGFGSHCLQIELKPEELIRPLLKKLEHYGKWTKLPGEYSIVRIVESYIT